MNVHHLELFYYVARHGGISEAVRNIPYGIQQPAVSGQVAQLEEFLGVTLFQRRPFVLTAQGEKLYKFIEPFFSNLEAVAGELQGVSEPRVRLGAATIILRDHLPDLFQNVRKRFPRMRISVCTGYQGELEALLQRGELDLAVTFLEKKTAAGLRSVNLLDLPLVLLVPKAHPVTAAAQLWKRDRIGEPLICMPASEAICKNFQAGLLRLGVDWFPSIEVSAVDLIESYVANGFGIGVSVRVPGADFCPQVRALPLPDFEPAHLGALWRGKPTALMQAFIEEMQSRARKLG